jgi:hypothetical protein
MPFLHLTTFIASDPERVFDLSRSLEFNKFLIKEYGGEINGSKINGLLEKGDVETYKGKHLMKERIVTVAVSEIKFPEYLLEEQKTGPFRKMKHEHYFKRIQNGTIMIDQFTYDIKKGIFGNLFNKIFIQRYITKLLQKRNQFIKESAEGNDWKKYLNR